MDLNFEQLLLFMEVIVGMDWNDWILVSLCSNFPTDIQNQAIRGVEIVPEMEIIIDKKIKEVSDIENIFKLKLMDKVNIQANTLVPTSCSKNFFSEQSKHFTI